MGRIEMILFKVQFKENREYIMLRDLLKVKCLDGIKKKQLHSAEGAYRRSFFLFVYNLLYPKSATIILR